MDAVSEEKVDLEQVKKETDRSCREYLVALGVVREPFAELETLALSATLFANLLDKQVKE